MASLTTVVAGLLFTPSAQASPAQAPYPDTSSYRSVPNTEIYRVVNEGGIWWTSPTGLRCGIDDAGGYGCSGPLPGVAAGENEVAWFVGDPFPRLYSTGQQRFSSHAAQTLINERTSIHYRGATCSVTRDSGVYCIHGDDPNSQLLVTSYDVFRGAEGLPAS